MPSDVMLTAAQRPKIKAKLTVGGLAKQFSVSHRAISKVLISTES